MLLRIAIAASALCAALPLGGEAEACTWNFPADVGDPNESEAERQRERLLSQRREARRLMRSRISQAQAALESGYDITGALAEILVPNIRPVPIERDSCAIPNEIDHAEGEETLADLLAGTRFADWGDRYYDFAPPWEGETIGPACNAEFRSRFAQLLRSRMTEPQLRDSYLFLATRLSHWKGDPAPLANVGHLSFDRGVISRLVAFEGQRRQLPLRWTAESYREGQAIGRWTERNRTGRALRAAMNEFWRENGPLLNAPERACPAATARWPSVQARIVAPLEEWVARYPNWTPQPPR